MLKKYPAILLCFVLCCAFANANCTTFSVREVTGCENTSTSYTLFYESGTPSVLIPGLCEDLVPQGLCYLAEKGWFVFAGYSSTKGQPSALIAVDEATGEIAQQVLLKNSDGSIYSGHAGGVCFASGNFYISNNHKLYRISEENFLTADGWCTMDEEIPVPVNSSYCCAADGVLYVGEFQYGTDYMTDSTHKIKTGDGLYKAWTCAYRLNEDGSFPKSEAGRSSAVPAFILATPEKIQGITVLNGNLYLSQSYGRKNSSLIMRFDETFTREADAFVEYEGTEVPVWFLDSAHRTACLMAPPMSESLCTANGCVYVLFESAANTYRKESNPSVNPMDRIFCLNGF